MTTQKQIEIAQEILKTGLVNSVFHSIQLIPDEEGGVFPAYPMGEEYSYSGIDDTKGLFAYIRNNGDLITENLKVEGCGHSYKVTAPMRVVFFNDNEDRNPDELVRRLASFTFAQGIFLSRVIQDKNRLSRDESPMFRTRFDGKTFYAAFDITATFLLLRSTCESAECIVHPNPITSCPAAAPQSSVSASS